MLDKYLILYDNTSCNLELLVLNSKTRSWFTSKLNFQISCQRHLKQRLLVAFFEIKRLLNLTFTLGPHTDDSCNFIANILLFYLLTCFFFKGITNTGLKKVLSGCCSCVTSYFLSSSFAQQSKGLTIKKNVRAELLVQKSHQNLRFFLALPMASIYSFVSFLSRPDIFKKHTSSALTKKFAIVVNYEMLYFGYKLWANNLYSLIKY